jgi:hypothetical protein
MAVIVRTAMSTQFEYKGRKVEMAYISFARVYRVQIDGVWISDATASTKIVATKQAKRLIDAQEAAQ